MKEENISVDVETDVPENQGDEEKKKKYLDIQDMEERKIYKIITENEIFLGKNLTLKPKSVLYIELKEKSEVQSILFKKDVWDKEKAITWLKAHNYEYSKFDDPEEGDYYHFTQEKPKKYDTLRLSGDEDSSKGQKALLAKGIKFIFGV